ncbi:MAG TPA: hypothetical protein VEQ41_07480 [Solirubrobacterales bacterium]|nr:hypothetical protein [Solirubrobacterales bacterium]
MAPIALRISGNISTTNGSQPPGARLVIADFDRRRQARCDDHVYIHAYVNVPVPTAIVTRVKIKKIRKGRLGTRAIARIPAIAGGSGSVTRFAMKIQRTFRHRGKRQSYLLARCADRRFFAKGSVAFTGGPRLVGTVVRGCRIRG